MSRFMLLVCSLLAVEKASAQPAVDHHLHLLRSMEGAPKGFDSAAELIQQMDQTGIRRGVVLSIAYRYGNPFRAAVPNERQRVKEENDWTAAQAARIASSPFVASIPSRTMHSKKSTAARGIPASAAA